MDDACLFWLKARPYSDCEVPDKKAAGRAFDIGARSSLL